MIDSGQRRHEHERYDLTTHTKTNHTLPDWIKGLFEERVSVGDTESRDYLIKDLRALGWTLQSIASASGVTRERVRQIATDGGENPGTAWSKPLPTPPVKATPVAREYIEPEDDALARMLELQPAAQSVRANSTEHRAAAEEYTRLIWQQHSERGVTLYRLAKRLGVTHGALRFRLARYGYKQPQTGTSKVYAPIKAENRV